VDEVLRVTALGEFIWHPEADRLIEEGDFSGSPAMPFILKALRRKEWQGLTDEEKSEIYNRNYNLYAHDMHIGDFFLIQQAVEAKLKEKNT